MVLGKMITHMQKLRPLSNTIKENQVTLKTLTRLNFINYIETQKIGLLYDILSLDIFDTTNKLMEVKVNKRN